MLQTPMSCEMFGTCFCCKFHGFVGYEEELLNHAEILTRGDRREFTRGFQSKRETRAGLETQSVCVCASQRIAVCRGLVCERADA